MLKLLLRTGRSCIHVFSKSLLVVLCFCIVSISCVFFLKFLDDVSSTESKEPSGLSEPVHLKEG